jgi:uncharacterized protein DUF3618
MPSTPEQLEREIAMTRHELARTLSELEWRTNPVRVFRRNEARIVTAAGVVLGVVVAVTVLKLVLRHR